MDNYANLRSLIAEWLNGALFLLRQVGCAVFAVFFDLDFCDPDAALGLVTYHGIEDFVNVPCETFAGGAGDDVGLKEVPKLSE